MKIRSQYFKEQKSYAQNTPQVTEQTLDCSLGVNPYGPPRQALEAARSFDPAHLGDYPHSHAVHDAIIRHWKDQVSLTPEQILLVDGSVSGLYLINALFADPGAQVVGFIPSFTDMIVNVELQGMRYIGVPSAAANGREDVDALLAAMDERVSLVYIDNPNNPTGQLRPQTELVRVLERARELGVYVLIDEAYGDFVSREESILSQLPAFPNLLVLRTFSKGFGLAGLRAGYIVAAPELIGYMSKASNPYTMSAFSRVVAAAAMEEGDYPASHGADFAAIKRALRDRTGHRLTMLCTDDRVPICSLRHSDPNADLQRLLFDHGVLTVSGAEFDDMDASAVRLRVPRPEEAEPLLRAVEAVDRS